MVYNAIYNTGPSINGTTQVGNIAVATGSPDYSVGDWTGGVDDTGCYVIIGDTNSTGLAGRSAGGTSDTINVDKPTFWKSTTNTDQSFLDLVNSLPNSPGDITLINDATDWLTSRDFWTSYGLNVIVTSNLVLNLDAANPASYPGSGTTWTSLVNGYTGSMGAGVGYSSNDGGVLTFNGTSNAFVDMYSSASSLVATTNNFSIESWYKSNNNFPAIVRTGIGSSGFVFGYFSGTGTEWKVTKYGVVDLKAGLIPQNTAWHHVVLTYSSTTGARVYVDGSLSGTANNNTNLKGGNQFSIGRGESVQLNGNMGVFRWYNAVLSETDVLQNFNALKSRYGL